MGAAVSTSSTSPCSSCSSFPPLPKKYDVFISFRGEDTRSNFTSHLYKALCDESITTYIDYKLNRGDQIAPSLLQAIQDSSVSVVVLSENYASSKWCLDELIHILRCRKHEGQVVIPVFCQVDPSDVRKQNGTYQQAFAKHERDFAHNLHKVNEWRNALLQTANLSGWNSRSHRDESELIQNIVSDVLEKLNIKYPSALKGLVGIDESCKKIDLLLEKTPIIGIWGMGGIGKTTIAKAIFAKHFSQYDSYCFLENFREQSEKHGLPCIRDKLLSRVLRDDTPKVVGSTFSIRRLRSKKVLIVLDDVSSSNQLEYLAQECNCLGPSSRVIITTRDRHLLIGNDAEIYEAKALNYQEALKLFCFKAFHQDHLKIGYEQLSKRAVVYAQGIPLALTVLGSFLYSKTMAEWDSELKKLGKTPPGDIQKVLILSYNELDHEQREMLLDIACFLKDEIIEDVIVLLDSYGFHGRSGLRTLADKALITIDSRVRMHNLIQEMGQEIIRQEDIKEPGRRSRLWDPEEIYEVLKYNQGTKAIEGIMLDMSKIRNLDLNTKSFIRMTNLRFLKFVSSMNKSNVNIPLVLELFSEKLRCFHWDGYPLKSLPSNFCPHKLVELNMQRSRVKKLWDGVQDLVNLKTIDMSESIELMELPDFSMAHNLESVDLNYCENLRSVHPSILSLHSLVDLDVSCCWRLESLQSETHLKSLADLNIDYCVSLKKLCLSSEELTELRLNKRIEIEILHFPVGRFTNLRELSINGQTLRSLPINELCCLTSLEVFKLTGFKQVIDKKELHSLFDAWSYLKELKLDECTNLSEVPDNINALTNLEILSLGETSVEILPACIEHLPYLREIRLRECKRLRSILGLPPCLEVLDASKCNSLEFHLNGFRQVIGKKELHILSVFDVWCYLRELCLDGCTKFSEIPDNINAFKMLESLRLAETSVEILPACIRHLSNLRGIYLTECRRLRSILGLPPNLQSFYAWECTSLETVFSDSLFQPRFLNRCYFLFYNCIRLDEHSVHFIEELIYFSIISTHGDVYTCYPGSRVPKWITYKQMTEASNTTEFTCNLGPSLGIVFCFVLSHFTPKENLIVRCNYSNDDNHKSLHRLHKYQHYYNHLNSDHVFLWYNKFPQHDARKSYRGKITCEFSVRHWCGDVFVNSNVPIKACGVCPIYDSKHWSWS